VLFRIVGDGAEREKIEAATRAQGIANVDIGPQQPRSHVPALIWDSDACLVLLKRSEVFKTVIPTKMLEFMACGRPVILGVEGQALELLQQADAGIAIPPEDADALAAAVLRLRADSTLRVRLGRNGEAFIQRNMSRQGTALDYERLLLRVAGRAKVEESPVAGKAANAG
jgi:glycosyltransferase involved in cell wall biosynthesis